MVNRLKEMKTCLEQVLNCVDEGVHVVNADGVTIYYNRTAAENDGMNPEDVLGKNILLLYPSLTVETSSLFRVLKTGQQLVNHEQTVVNSGGKTVSFLYSTFPIFKDGVLIGACDISRDITKIKELSEKLVDLHAELSGRSQAGHKISNAKPKGKPYYQFNDFVGSHDSIIQLKALAQRVAGGSSPILVFGETGTGKELIVQSIHSASPRKQKPFVAQNCAALPATLLESILFGTVKGSFTGAVDRPGLFELANEGTLFLDEINSMPLELQGKLLRVLQEGNIRRVGDTKLIQLNTRIITCTNIDPEEAIKNKELRVDLYYRLNVVSLRVPSLRERKSDIPVLTEHFIKLYNQRLDRQVQDLSQDVEKLFLAYEWPGNVREMQHALEHAMNIVTGTRIELEHLPVNLKQSRNEPLTHLWESIEEKNLSRVMKKIECQIIHQVLKKYKGNVSRAADELGIPRQTLQYKLRTGETDFREESGEKKY